MRETSNTAAQERKKTDRVKTETKSKTKKIKIKKEKYCREAYIVCIVFWFFCVLLSLLIRYLRTK